MGLEISLILRARRKRFNFVSCNFSTFSRCKKKKKEKKKFDKDASVSIPSRLSPRDCNRSECFFRSKPMNEVSMRIYMRLPVSFTS